MLKHARLPILGFAAYSGTGKTTLLTKILPLLRQRGLRVGMIKHAHHSFEVDQPGKDSYALRKAGAEQMLVASRHRWALMAETPGNDEPRLDELLRHLDQDALDMILVEGFKAEPIPKIEVCRPTLGHPLLCRHDRLVIAVATDAPLPVAVSIPLLDLNRPQEIAEFVVTTLFAANPKRHAARGDAMS